MHCTFILGEIYECFLYFTVKLFSGLLTVSFFFFLIFFGVCVSGRIETYLCVYVMVILCKAKDAP